MASGTRSTNQKAVFPNIFEKSSFSMVFHRLDKYLNRINSLFTVYAHVFSELLYLPKPKLFITVDIFFSMMAGIKRDFDGKEKRKHITLTIVQKVDIIRKLESGSSAKSLALSFGISSRTVYDIKKNKEKILNYYSKSDCNAGLRDRKTTKTAKSANLDNILYEWFRQRRSEGVPITGPILREKARQLHKDLNIEGECSFSTGWLASFKQRHGIRYIKACGEKLSADSNAADEFIDELSTIINEENLSPHQIYNADETGLMWRCLPRQTFVSSNESNPPGFKEAKERVTILVCSNAAGTHKCKLLLIGKSAHPRALKRVKVLPVHYRNNQTAWMTADLMRDWFENYFVKEARDHCTSVGLPQDCKILLLLDNFRGHSGAMEKDNVVCLFLPPNTTSLIQPMDQGVIKSFKCHYKTAFLKQLLSAMTTLQTLNECRKNFNIKDCIFLVAEAWSCVSKDTLVNAWHKVWPASLFIDNDDDQAEFSGFRPSNDQNAELRTYVQNALTNLQPGLLEEEDVVHWITTEEPCSTAKQMSDEEIINNVLNAPDSSETESEDEAEAEKITFKEGLSHGHKYLDFLIQQNFISEQEVMFVQRLQKKILDNQPSMKQTTIQAMFEKMKNKK